MARTAKKVDSPTESGLPIAGRNAAYIARNRAALLQAASEVYASLGPEATVEQIAAHAGVSVSTIYAHFPSKTDLFKGFSIEASKKWQEWVNERVSAISDPLTKFVTIPRLLCRQKLTHPLYAAVAKKNFHQMTLNRSDLTSEMRNFANTLLKAKVLNFDHPAARLENYAACIFAAYEKYLQDDTFTEEECDTSLEIALLILNISPAQAKKLAHAKLPEISS